MSFSEALGRWTRTPRFRGPGNGLRPKAPGREGLPLGARLPRSARPAPLGDHQGQSQRGRGAAGRAGAGDRAWYLPGSGGAGDLRQRRCCILETHRGQRPHSDHQGLQVQPDPTSASILPGLEAAGHPAGRCRSPPGAPARWGHRPAHRQQVPQPAGLDVPLRHAPRMV